MSNRKHEWTIKGELMDSWECQRDQCYALAPLFDPGQVQRLMAHCYYKAWNIGYNEGLAGLNDEPDRTNETIEGIMADQRAGMEE